MQKSVDAFRTISEVAEDLVLPQHVLRFWESRFPQIRPLKRAGGRRYYRPADVELLRTIRQLLYNEGYTIKGVQRLLKKQGARSLRVSEPSLAITSAGEPDEGADDALDAVDASDSRLAVAGTYDDLAGSQDLDGLREALACVEECLQILSRLHTLPS